MVKDAQVGVLRRRRMEGKTQWSAHRLPASLPGGHTHGSVGETKPVPQQCLD
jgi:hypothetical protein